MFWMIWLGCGRVTPTSVESPEVRDGVLPLVVAVHGYGDRPESLREMVDHCALPVRVVAPQGPIPLGEGPDAGFAWFALGTGPNDEHFRAETVSRAADGLASEIERAKQEQPTERVVLTGFSQGGVLAFAVALLHPETVTVAIPIAGGLPPVLIPEPLPPAGPPIHALHGERDTVIPMGPTRELVDRLAAAGWTADLTVFPDTAHALPPPMHEAFCRTLAAAIAPAEPATAR